MMRKEPDSVLIQSEFEDIIGDRPEGQRLR